MQKWFVLRTFGMRTSVSGIAGNTSDTPKQLKTLKMNEILMNEREEDAQPRLSVHGGNVIERFVL